MSRSLRGQKSNFKSLILKTSLVIPFPLKISSVCSLLSFPADRPFLTFDSLAVFLLISYSEVLCSWRFWYPVLSMDQQTQHHLEFVRNAGCGHTPDLLNLKFSQVPSGLVCTLPSETHWSATLVKPAKETSQFTVFINRLQRIIKWNQTIPFALWITEYYFFQISAPAFFSSNWNRGSCPLGVPGRCLFRAVRPAESSCGPASSAALQATCYNSRQNTPRQSWV